MGNFRVYPGMWVRTSKPLKLYSLDTNKVLAVLEAGDYQIINYKSLNFDGITLVGVKGFLKNDIETWGNIDRLYLSR